MTEATSIDSATDVRAFPTGRAEVVTKARMTRSLRAVVAAGVGLMGLGQSPAVAGMSPTASPSPEGPAGIQRVAFYADQFQPTKFNGGGGPADLLSLGHPQVWSLGHVKVAESQDDPAVGLSAQPFALGILTVEQTGVGTSGVPTFAVGEFVKSKDPSHPYRFEGVEVSSDGGALRGQVFDFIGEQTGPVPPPASQSGP